MKTIKLKHTEASGGNLMPQHPDALLGYHNGCMTLAVTGLPDSATIHDAKAVVNLSVIPAWVDTIDASQKGKNLYHAENLTPEQLTAAPDWYREKYCQKV